MLTKFFDKSYLITVIALVICAIAVQIPVLLKPNNFIAFTNNSLYSFSPRIYIILLFPVYLVSIYITNIINKSNLLVSKSTLLPPVIFILLFQFKLMQVELFVVVCLLIVLHKIFRILKHSKEDLNINAGKCMHSAGIYIAIATIINFSSILLLPVAFLSLFIFGIPSKLRYMLIALLGFCLPFILFLFSCYSFNQFDYFIHLPDTLKFGFSLFHIQFNKLQYASLIFYFILFLFSTTFVINKMPNMTLLLRQKYSFLIITTLLMLVCIFITNSPLFFFILFLSTLPFLLSFVLYNSKSLFSDIFILILLAFPIILLLIQNNVNQ